MQPLTSIRLTTGSLARRSFSGALLVIGAGLLALTAPRASAEGGLPPRTVQEWLRTIERAKRDHGEEWSVLVKDLATGETILAYQPTSRLIPASNRKLMVFILAQEQLGPEFRFRTELGWTGQFSPDRGVLKGHVVLRSNGDPTMTSRYLDGRNPVTVLRGWIARLVSRGVKRIEGDVIVDASAFGPDQSMLPEYWEPHYRGEGYAQYPSALTLNENRLRIEVTTEGNVGAPGRVKVYPSSLGFGVVNKTKLASGSQRGLYVAFDEAGKNLIVSGRVGKRISSHAVHVPIPNPLQYIGAIVRDAVISEGIVLTGSVRIVVDPREGRRYLVTTVLASHESAPVGELLREMMRDSDNFLAEQLWRAAAWRGLGQGDIDHGRRLERQWYENHGLSRIQPGYDGSGLSRQNRVAAAEIVSVLETAYDSPYGRSLIDALPSSGQSGTLRRRTLGKTSGRVVAKTGTLSGAGALSGFIRDRAGRERWAFSLIGNEPKAVRGRLWTRQNEIMEILIGMLDSGERLTNPSTVSPPVKRYKPGTKVYVGGRR